jgi:hypothetical protein
MIRFQTGRNELDSSKKEEEVERISIPHVNLCVVSPTMLPRDQATYQQQPSKQNPASNRYKDKPI